MIGTLRLSLALLIMVAHLGPYMFTSYLPPIAVLSFYGLAGYTATASIQGPYKGRQLAFMASRIMRLWPSYLVVFILSLLWLRWGQPWGAVGVVSTWRIIREALMLVPAGSTAIVPTGWVLPWFLLGYIVIALGLAATPRKSGFLLIVMVILAQWLSFEASFSTYYYSPVYAGLGFIVGASIYHLNVIIPRDRFLGKWAGAISYPLFLCHYLVGAIMATAFNLSLGWILFLVSLPPSLIISHLLVIWVEQPIAQYRSRLKTQN